jgi:hypothetical protein
MQMIYNSDSFTVVLFEAAPADASAGTAPPADDDMAALGHVGYEIVDKFARREIFLQGAMARSFKEGVEALILTQPSEEDIDDYLGRFASLMQQSVILH